MSSINMLSTMSLAYAVLAFFSRGPDAHAFVPLTTPHRQFSVGAAAEATAAATLSTADAVACFGRLADRAYVLPPADVEGTAASGYEFGVLEAGRPKWLCTYEERAGKTQGGGNELRHVPAWRRCVFGGVHAEGGGDSVLPSRAALREALFSDDLKFQMPLAAPSGTSAAKEPITNEAVVDAVWRLLGGGDDGSPLTSKTASASLQRAAREHGSDTDCHLTYAVFEKALLSCAAAATAGDGHAAEAATPSATPLAAAAAASFEDAQAIGRDLAGILVESCAHGEPLPAEATALLRTLVSSSAGARGWFVSLLTTPEFEPVFRPPLDETLLAALCAAPDPNVQLVTMNVAMPVATELVHAEMGNDELAAGSHMTARRATVLAKELLPRLPELRESFEALLSAVDEREEGADEEWVKFCKKWGYGLEQRRAIQAAVEQVLRD